MHDTALLNPGNEVAVIAIYDNIPSTVPELLVVQRINYLKVYIFSFVSSSTTDIRVLRTHKVTSSELTL